ncbi:Sterol desaturase/sphingolipid hydroxylase, fatty acid hydroxylase superfamily [Cnuella takakiae]|uniref:Sterol desaturase/sphingolipid hydroxylase, fatty acid hydroxylase superfamily n=1 Tax=Cnuella takakiae TaxID=1302690 RepID=A0A1M4ZZM4_9BACT|nr:sterol desaturase family protein [Cnuella takakiae]OLY92150.1 sterol desaturase [Cnuella takakiae]SHF23465.1 Sterol desaturase/sphingolipid hydroxylase, fatty acid hydroxylase superfamily [Cnuella takakiae]
MNERLLALAIPLFLFFILLEYAAARRQKKQTHQYAESIANLNVGIAERVTDMLTTGSFYFLFDYLHRHFAVWHIEANVWTWILLFLATDFVWYWYHRAGHRINIFWSVHVVHHQSEDFNYTVSTRITILQAVARALFWSVLPLVGFPAHMIAVLLLVHGAYPFFTHTQVIGKLGWLEYIIVTPSHHRVHHSSNPEYLDKNYGDMLIIWDKLFGTFALEKSEPRYGLTTPLNSYSFLWQHFHFILELVISWRRAAGWKAKLRVLFGKPDDIDPRIRLLLEKKLLRRKELQVHSPTLLRFVLVQTVATLVLLFCTIWFRENLAPFQVGALALLMLLTVVNSGAMLEQRQWVFHLDYLRLVLAGLLFYTYLPHVMAAYIIILLLSLVLAKYQSMQRWYCNALYG